MAVVSIDLASRRYRDIGIAILSGTPTSVEVDLVRPHERGLNGSPDPEVFARTCTDLASEAKADLILIDGPQGWRGQSSSFEHMRMCERCTRTPGKTGLPEIVKPASWTRMARFSIALFDALHAGGWPRFSGTWPVQRAVVETFPTHAWRTLGLQCLPGRARRGTELAPWVHRLSAAVGVGWPREPNHDELQAVVAGLAGLVLQSEGMAACDVHGSAPFQEDGSWREGFIVSPTTLASEWCHPAMSGGTERNSSCHCAARRSPR